ncbi:MAG: hypothetical protein WCJ30_05175 [Deltaproteobacteria bacterium]
MAVPLTLPFDFAFFGHVGPDAWVGSNGFMGFGSTPSTAYDNACLPTSLATNPQNALFAYWDDLVLRTNGVCVATTGTAPNRVEVLTWSDASVYADPGAHITFSVVLTETTDTIDINFATYNVLISQQATATIGIQNGNGSATGGTPYLQHSCNTLQPILGPPPIRYQPGW